MSKELALLKEAKNTLLNIHTSWDIDTFMESDINECRTMEAEISAYLRDHPNLLLSAVIETFGAKNQLDMVVEEIGELLQAMNKIKRGGGLTDAGYKKPTEGTPQSQCMLYHELCGEVADMKIMIMQMELMLDPANIQLIMERKLERLAQRLAAHGK